MAWRSNPRFTTADVMSLVVFENPIGTIDGINTHFTLTYTPSSALMVYQNGLLKLPTLDYVNWDNAIVFNGPSIPQVGDVLFAFYWRA